MPEPKWSFRDYLEGRGTNPIRDWLHGLPIGARAKVESILDHLASEERLAPPYVKLLSGHQGILELRITYSGVEYRPLLCYGPKPRTLTILIGATERDDKFSPRNAPSIAKTRRDIVLNDSTRSCEHDPE